MTARQLTEELHHSGAQELLRTCALARLAYNGPDGLPRVIPTGFYWNGEQIVVCTAPTAPKVRALSARPDVALTIDSDASGAAKCLLVRGRATMSTVEGVADEYLAASAKTMDAPRLAEFERQTRAVYQEMVRIVIEPKWARFHDYGAGRLPAFLANLIAGQSGDQ